MPGQAAWRTTITLAILGLVSLLALFGFRQDLSYRAAQQTLRGLRNTVSGEQGPSAVAELSNGLHEDVGASSAGGRWESEAGDQDDAEVDTVKLLEAEAAEAERKAVDEEIARLEAPTDAQPDSPTLGPDDDDSAAPAPETITKAVIMGATTTESSSWTSELTSDWTPYIYCLDPNATTATCPTNLTVRHPAAREAMPYLTYIITHYTALPDIMAFIHPHRAGWPAAWHNDAPDHDAVVMLQQLQVSTVLERGYVNLRCITDPGCPAEIQPWREPAKGPGKGEEWWEVEQAFPYFYSAFFGGKTVGEMREEIAVVGTPCCAQFAVSRAQVLERGLGWYERVREVLEGTVYEDEVSGRVME